MRLSVMLVSALAVTVLAAPAHGSDPGEDDDWNVHMGMGMGIATGTWCSDTHCRADPAALLVRGQLAPREGIGPYVSLTVVMSLRETCVGPGNNCGSMPMLGSVSAGYSYRRRKLRAAFGFGIMGTGTAIDDRGLLNTEVLLGLQVYKNRHVFIDVQAHGLASVTHPTDAHMLGVAVIFEPRLRFWSSSK